MAAGDSLTAQRLRELLHYNAETGVLKWKVRPQITSKVEVGDTAGRLDSKGYLRIGIGRRQYRAHRLIWLYVTGEWPPHEIDHKDRNRTNNAWLNLRPATSGQNKQNATLRKDNVSGVRGVYFEARRQVWCAQITVNGTRRGLGAFPTRELAQGARLNAEATHFTHSEALSTPPPRHLP